MPRSAAPRDARIRVAAARIAPLPAALILGLVVGGSAPLRAQHPAELSAEEKTEIFVGHLVRVARIDPERYRSLVLEYEIGRALRELGAAARAAPDAADHDHESGAHGAEEEGEPGAGPEHPSALDGDFIQSALKEVYPRYAEALALLEGGKPEAALDLTRSLASGIEKGAADGAGANPYLAAYASLLAAEAEYALLSREPEATAAAAATGEARAAIERLITRAQSLVEKDRLYVIPDYRASQLIALAFERLGKPILESTQYALLLTDYPYLPAEVKAQAVARLTALGEKRPLGTVATWMNGVERLLEDEITAPEPTQAKETEIVYALDKLIELQEARERKTCGNCGSQGCQGACRGGKSGASRSQQPAEVSSLPKAKGQVLLHGVSRADRGSIWGQLREKDAARALQGFRGKLPPHYERLLEQYYKNLSQLE
jgi:hypothetical protein